MDHQTLFVSSQKNSIKARKLRKEASQTPLSCQKFFCFFCKRSHNFPALEAGWGHSRSKWMKVSFLSSKISQGFCPSILGFLSPFFNRTSFIFTKLCFEVFPPLLESLQKLAGVFMLVWKLLFPEISLLSFSVFSSSGTWKICSPALLLRKDFAFKP